MIIIVLLISAAASWIIIFQLSQRIKEQRIQLDIQQQQMANKQTNTRPALSQLNELNYLIRLAEDTLHYSHQTQSSIDLLNAALNRAKVLGNTELITAINNDLSHLKEHTSQNTQTILSTINNMIEQANLLPVLNKTLTNNKETVLEKQESNTVQDYWINTISQLKNIIIIHRTDEPIAPLLSLSQQTFLVINIKINLEKMQWAVLHNDNDLFHRTVNQTKQWLQHYFTTSKTQTDLLDSLGKLQSLILTKPVTESLSSLQIVDTLFESKSKEPTAVEKQESTTATQQVIAS